MTHKGKSKYENGTGYSFDVNADELRKKTPGEVGRIVGDLFDEMLDTDALLRHHEEHVNSELKHFWQSLQLCIEGGCIIIDDRNAGTELCWKVPLVDAMQASIQDECPDSLAETMIELKKCIILLEKHLQRAGSEP